MQPAHTPFFFSHCILQALVGLQNMFQENIFVIDENTATVQIRVLNDNKEKNRSWKNCQPRWISCPVRLLFFSLLFSVFSQVCLFLHLFLLNAFQDAEIQFLTFPS